MAKIQDAVWMHPCGLELSKAQEAASAESKKSVLRLGHVELNEGPEGHNGTRLYSYAG
ncbi:hypothetical protein OK016_01035 [Vibrio chagasii]|nr:hypothetical protein [Vibrio chagasii]